MSNLWNMSIPAAPPKSKDEDKISVFYTGGELFTTDEQGELVYSVADEPDTSDPLWGPWVDANEGESYDPWDAIDDLIDRNVSVGDLADCGFDDEDLMDVINAPEPYECPEWAAKAQKREQERVALMQYKADSICNALAQADQLISEGKLVLAEAQLLSWAFVYNQLMGENAMEELIVAVVHERVRRMRRNRRNRIKQLMMIAPLHRPSIIEDPIILENLLPWQREDIKQMLST